jgi:hypothetical protein
MHQQLVQKIHSVEAIVTQQTYVSERSKLTF